MSKILSKIKTYVLKNLPTKAGDTRDASLIPGSGRSPGGGRGNPLQYSCLENSMDRRDWQATVHEVTDSDMTEYTSHTYTYTHTQSQEKTRAGYFKSPGKSLIMLLWEKAHNKT